MCGHHQKIGTKWRLGWRWLFNTGFPKKIVPFSKIQSVQLTPLSTQWAPRKKNKKRVQSFSDTCTSFYISKYFVVAELLCVMILTVYVSATVLITQGNYIGCMFRLLNSRLQAYYLQVKSQDAVHTLGSQCVYISEILKQIIDYCRITEFPYFIKRFTLQWNIHFHEHWKDQTYLWL